MENSFFNDKEKDGNLRQAYEDYLLAKQEGNLDDLQLDEEAYEYILDRLVEEGDTPQVLELSGVAFSKLPYSEALLSRYCDTLILSGNPDKALEILSQYSDSFPQSVVVQLLFARGNIAKNRFRHARDYFYRALECGVSDSDTIDSVCAIAQDCIDYGNYREAIFYLEKASRIGTLPYEYFNDYAFCYDKLDDLQKAEEYYNLYLDKNPFNDTVWFNMGTIQARMKDFDKAIEAFEYSVALNPSNSSSLYNLSVVFMNLQRYREAAQTFEQFVAIDSDVLGLLGLGESYIRLGRNSDAVDQFAKVIASDDKVAEGHAGLNTVKAIECYNKGDMTGFKSAFIDIYRTGTAWIGVVYDLLPQLENDKQFIDFLLELKQNDNI